MCLVTKLWSPRANIPQVPEILLIRKTPPSKVKQKVMIIHTITYGNVVKTILEKVDLAMFDVKYFEGCLSKSYEILQV